jgi:uncharacterized membrane protein YobD (UPF0266 family)
MDNIGVSEVEIFGKKVENKYAKLVVAGVVLAILIIAIAVAAGITMLLLSAAAVLAIALVPIHFLLRTFGRKGFFYKSVDQETGKITAEFTFGNALDHTQ